MTVGALVLQKSLVGLEEVLTGSGGGDTAGQGYTYPAALRLQHTWSHSALGWPPRRLVNDVAVKPTRIEDEEGWGLSAGGSAGGCALPMRDAEQEG